MASVEDKKNKEMHFFTVGMDMNKIAAAANHEDMTQYTMTSRRTLWLYNGIINTAEWEDS